MSQAETHILVSWKVAHQQFGLSREQWNSIIATGDYFILPGADSWLIRLSDILDAREVIEQQSEKEGA